LVAFQTTARKLRDLSLTDNGPNRRRIPGLISGILTKTSR
jgi:hypothetical protein